MRTVRYLLPGLSILLLLSCGRRQAAALLDAAESCVQDRPDSSLAMLERIEAKDLAEPKFQARAILLKAIAADKVYNDSGMMVEEMKRSCEYYQRHGSRREKMLAWYYLGDQQYDAADYVNAVICFTKALEIAEKIADWYYAGMAAREAAYSYQNTYLTKDAYESMIKACAYFKRAGRREHYGYAAIMTGVFCKQLKLYEKGEEVLKMCCARQERTKIR